jgi:hypothetical protein
MSDETLQRFLERVTADEAFRDRMQNDWKHAIDELDLSPAELAAVATQDEDALRRLVGAEVTPYSANFYTTAFICSLVCVTTLDTPGSGRDCGTGQCRGTPGSGQGCGTGANCRVMR